MFSRKLIEFLFSAVIVLFLGWVLWEPQNWPAPARLFPWSLGFSVLALALIQLVVAGRAVFSEKRIARGKKAQDKLPRSPVNLDDHHLAATNAASFAANPSALRHAEPAGRRVMTICAWLVVFFLGIWLVGFKIGAFLLTFAFLKLTAKEKWPISAAMALGTYLFFWLVFDIGLKLPLGNGALGDFFTELTG
jgi:hypothetical protein